MLSAIKKWGTWFLVVVLIAGVAFLAVRAHQYERALQQAIESKQKADEALSIVKAIERQLQHILDETKRLDEKQAEIDARVRERDQKLQELERRVKK